MSKWTINEARVDRCACRNVLFCDLEKAARQSGLPVEEVAEEMGCGSACGLCVPYIKLMVKTGLTELPVIGSDKYRQLQRESKTAGA